MRHTPKVKPSEFLNISINILALTIFCGALWVASHTQVWWEFFLAAIVFAYAGNTLFALLHEAVHRVYSHHRFVNEFFGNICAAVFPTGFTFQRICHLGHHLRNRTDHEMFDMYYPEDSKFLKFSQFYAILTGIYWLTIPIGWLLYLVFPWSYRLLKTDRVEIKHTGAIMMLPFLDHPKKIRIRLEILFTILFQCALFYFLDLKFAQTFACYWIFGMFWGSLQYADHAWSERDIQTGAWNLKVNPITRLIFLNYHLHLAHHSNPQLPWNHLPKHVDTSKPQPSFFKIYIEMWKGPRPATEGPPKPVSAAIEELVAKDEDLKLENVPNFEWLCLQQYYLFSKRNLRYLKIALIQYFYAFVDLNASKTMRYGFCALQWVDDLLDEDRPSDEEPLFVVQALRKAVEENAYQKIPLHYLMERFFNCFENPSERAEAKKEVLSVLDAMLFDRERVLQKRTLKSEELRLQHHKTFTTSLNLTFLGLGSPLRASDLPEILDIFGWCSTVRDLDEDLSKNLINIPNEVVTNIPEFYQLTTEQKIQNPLVQGWLKNETHKMQDLFVQCEQKLPSLREIKGAKIFEIFLKSMKKYAANSQA